MIWMIQYTRNEEKIVYCLRIWQHNIRIIFRQRGWINQQSEIFWRFDVSFCEVVFKFFSKLCINSRYLFILFCYFYLIFQETKYNLYTFPGKGLHPPLWLRWVYLETNWLDKISVEWASTLALQWWSCRDHRWLECWWSWNTEQWFEDLLPLQTTMATTTKKENSSQSEWTWFF